MKAIKYIVVHCADTPDEHEFSAEDVHRWHLQRGWSGIGYHAVIQRNGAVEMGRPPYWDGAHVRGRNDESLGVCLIGRAEFTDAQFEALAHVIMDWQGFAPDAEIVGHCDLDPKKPCPNFDVREWWNIQ